MLFKIMIEKFKFINVNKKFRHVRYTPKSGHDFYVSMHPPHELGLAYNRL